ncbi:hypothetical protein [Desulfoluna sp.]|uniref:hypothetical protein n=1 Tax=Desulfoluna sp. TaxID=2045199 RepID=UPI0026061BF5|nr:hypothetical protein [Desulfoluna sp.]
MRTLSLTALAVLTILASTAAAFYTTEFKIRVDITPNAITLIPVEGCTWSATTFKKTDRWPRLIVTSDEAYKAISRSTQPTGSFSFVLLPEDRGAKLTSICGITWGGASFHGGLHPDSPVSWHVDNMGVNVATPPE